MELTSSRGDESIMRTRLQGLQLLTVKQATDPNENIHNKSIIEHFVALTVKRSWSLTQKDGKFAFIPSDDCAGINTLVANAKQAAYAQSVHISVSQQLSITRQLRVYPV